MIDDQRLRKAVLDVWKKEARGRTVVAAGTSMRPLIKEGYALTVVPMQESRQARIGDIILFDRGGGMIAHRMIGRKHRCDGVWFQEKGDNTFSPEWVHASSIIGKVVAIDTGTHVIDLTRWYWIPISRIVGYYWHWLFLMVGIILRVKTTLLPHRQLTRFGRIYAAVLRWLEKFPTIMLRIK
ncbi:MAG: S24/S26 family peptidase [Desulfobacterota bacterium]|nr:S24/S26 family peptidase [Thermodesulfobacteriota bacterium]